MAQLKSIQVLRAIAATAVFLCHLFAIEAGQADRDTHLAPVWVAGAYGVDLFFVISGFVIVWVAADRPVGRISASQFLYARVSRIYPTWWLFLGLMMLALMIFRGAPWDPLRLDQIGLDGPTHVFRSFFLLPQPDHPTLGVGWTLVHEMYFYIGFAALVWVLPQRDRIYGLLAWGALVVAGAVLGLSSAFGRNAIELIFYPMTLQFIAGGFVAYAIKAGVRRFAHGCAIVGACGLVAMFFSHGSDWVAALGQVLPQPWPRTLMFGIPSAVLIYGLVALELQGKAKACFPKALVELGNWSYAFYLCHVLTISVAGRLTYQLLDSEQAWVNALFCFNAAIATLLCAALTYRFFEAPMIRYLKDKRPRFGSARASVSSNLN
ncbi:MAG: acyltransferase [Pseudomonadota bacterium]